MVKGQVLTVSLLSQTLYQRSLQVEPRQANGTSGLTGSRIMKQFFHVDP
jgi:hypothetical protein